ncbi:MAG: hypothetical protein ACRD0H_20510, partial [Actinomycetes bacterium]
MTDVRLVVRVVVDGSGPDKAFDYLVPEDWDFPIQVGTRVRVALGPRRASGWVGAVGVTPPAGVELRPL